MEEPNYLNREIDSADTGARYDAAVKRILAAKEILARILVLAVPEFRDYSIQEATRAIEGEPEVGTRNVYPVPEAINGCKNESKLPGEGTVNFDIVFSVLTKEGKRRKMFINLEAQNSSYPGYSIVSRGVVYCARLISEQLDKEFTTSTYDDAKKVYSIWICMKPPKKHSKDAIPSNHIVQYNLIPSVVFPPDANINDLALGVYDLMSVIIITLVDDPKKTDNELIGMLSTLLSDAIDAATKKRKLAQEYGLPLSRKISKEVWAMCNLSEGLIQKAVEETKEKYMAELAKKDEELATMQTKGESKMAALISAMSVNGDTENIAKVAANPSFREEMYAKYGIE